MYSLNIFFSHGDSVRRRGFHSFRFFGFIVGSHNMRNFTYLCPPVTLKMRSRLPKSNQPLSLS